MSLSHENERGEPSTNGSAKASPLRRSVANFAASGPGTVEQAAEAIGEAADVLAVTAEEVLGSDDLLLTEESAMWPPRSATSTLSGYRAAP